MLDRRAWLAVIVGAAGAAAAIDVMEFFAVRTAIPLMAIPFGTSIVLVLGSPEVEAAQPWALIGGHLVATRVGLLDGQDCRTAALGGGVGGRPCRVAVHAARTFHPSAGIDRFLVVVNDMF